jgi:hypothetical protein
VSSSPSAGYTGYCAKVSLCTLVLHKCC